METAGSGHCGHPLGDHVASRLSLRLVDALDVVEDAEEDLAPRHITEQGRDDALQALVDLVGAHPQQDRDGLPLRLVDTLPRPVARIHVAWPLGTARTRPTGR